MFAETPERLIYIRVLSSTYPAFALFLSCVHALAPSLYQLIRCEPAIPTRYLWQCSLEQASVSFCLHIVTSLIGITSNLSMKNKSIGLLTWAHPPTGLMLLSSMVAPPILFIVPLAFCAFLHSHYWTFHFGVYICDIIPYVCFTYWYVVSPPALPLALPVLVSLLFVLRRYRTRSNPLPLANS